MDTDLRAEKASYAVGGKALLTEITVDLFPGTVHVLVGPNGAGKSTLLQLLAGNIVPDSGDVFLDGQPLRDYSKKHLALRRAVMPQDVVLSLAFTAEEVVMMGRYPHMDAKKRAPGALAPAVDARTEYERHAHGHVVDEMMRRTDTDGLRKRLYPTLSGGEQARVTLARVLAQETTVLFLDEPTASLDPRHQHLVMAVARRHAREGGTVLAVLHDLNLASMYADDVILMSAGRIRAQGRPVDVLQPSLLGDVFQTKFHVTDHPLLPHPLVLSLPMASG